MKKISIIVAVDEKMGIGKNGDLAWKISGDMKYFKDTTLETEGKKKQNAVVMGRKTWESIPEKFRPLPGRINCILTRDETTRYDDVMVFNNIVTCIEDLQKFPAVESIFVIGGSEIYKTFLESDLLTNIYITRVVGDHKCDTFFGEIPDNFHMTEKTNYFEEGNYFYSFERYEKR